MALVIALEFASRTALGYDPTIERVGQVDSKATTSRFLWNPNLCMAMPLSFDCSRPWIYSPMQVPKLSAVEARAYGRFERWSIAKLWSSYGAERLFHQ